MAEREREDPYVSTVVTSPQCIVSSAAAEDFCEATRMQRRIDKQKHFVEVAGVLGSFVGVCFCGKQSDNARL